MGLCSAGLRASVNWLPSLRPVLALRAIEANLAEVKPIASPWIFVEQEFPIRFVQPHLAQVNVQLGTPLTLLDSSAMVVQSVPTWIFQTLEPILVPVSHQQRALTAMILTVTWFGQLIEVLDLGDTAVYPISQGGKGVPHKGRPVQVRLRSHQV